MTEDRPERAARRRQLAAELYDRANSNAVDPEEAARLRKRAEALRDTAAEHDGLSLTGAATAREGE